MNFVSGYLVPRLVNVLLLMASQSCYMSVGEWAGDRPGQSLSVGGITRRSPASH